MKPTIESIRNMTETDAMKVANSIIEQQSPDVILDLSARGCIALGYLIGIRSALSLIDEYESKRIAVTFRKPDGTQRTIPQPLPTLFDGVPYDEDDDTGTRHTGTGKTRKSPVAHNAYHHDDDFWIAICREYQQLKGRHPRFTQAEFVRMKNNPRLNVKTFGIKLNQLLKHGGLKHKPRTRKH